MSGNVRSAPLKDDVLVASARTALDSLTWRAAGLVALAIGGPLWLIGARYTVLGAPRVVALILRPFGVPLDLRLPIGWPLLWLTVGVGAAVSLVEFGARPRSRFFARSVLLGLVLFLAWFVTNAGDLASTYFGVTMFVEPSGDSGLPLARWVAATPWAAILWTCFLTYAPELLMLGGVRWLVMGRL